MSSNDNYNIRRSRRSERSGRYRKRSQRRRSVITALIAAAIFIAALIVVVNAATGDGKKNNRTQETVAAATKETTGSEIKDTETSVEEQTTDTESKQDVPDGGDEGDTVKKAEALAVQYDYDGALKLLKEDASLEKDEKAASLIKEIEEKKNSLVATSPEEVTHVFFHSLIVDASEGFSLTDNPSWNRLTPGYCQWFCTVSEFDKVIQQMYDRGYVLVSLYDLVDITTDANGVEHVKTKDIYLPEGKTPVVLSIDDLSYYHCYDGRGVASKMIIDSDGTPTCEYIDSEGKTHVGSYDCVPRLDDFLDEHPDFSYKGAKGTIALTGYNGILGYRTDYCYRDNTDLEDDQIAWLAKNPDFDWEKECEEAKKVAQAIKDDGWTFASHTWGHMKIADSGMERIIADTGKWQERVASLIGDTDIIIFAHGQDLTEWDKDYESSEKYEYMKSHGFTIYCNVDSSKYYVRVGDEYFRMGRRNIDGLRIWQSVHGGKDYISDLFDGRSVIDPERPTNTELYKV